MIHKWEYKFDQEQKLKKEKELINFKQHQQDETENKKIKEKLEDKFDQELKLKNEIETFKFEELKKKKLQESGLDEDLISKLENFEIDSNKKN